MRWERLEYPDSARSIYGEWARLAQPPLRSLKLLWWDRDGLALFYKRLESGTFETLPADDGTQVIEIDATQLAMLLGGVM